MFKKTLFLSLLVATFSMTLSAQNLRELFQKAKEEVKAASWSNALRTLDELDAESRLPGAERQRAQLEPVLAFYRGVSFANLDRPEDAQAQFEIYLASNPNASLDASLYSKKALKAMDDVRRGMTARGGPPSGMPSMASAYREFRMSSSTPPDPPREDWADGPVKALMTPDERRDWTRLIDPVSRSEFVTKFWALRNPKPETPENEARQEFEKRVAFADRNFTQGEIRGSMTDRGMVFLLLGPPTYVGRRPIAAGEDPAEALGNSTVSRNDVAVAVANATASAATAGRRLSTGQQAAIADSLSGPGASMKDSAAAAWREVWHYRHELLPSSIPYQQVDFDFITSKGYGENVLQREARSLTTLDAARKSPAMASLLRQKNPI